jgi:hypothetical protein
VIGPWDTTAHINNKLTQMENIAFVDMVNISSSLENAHMKDAELGCTNIVCYIG